MNGGKQELWIKSAVAEEMSEGFNNEIFCANAKIDTFISFALLSYYETELSKIPKWLKCCRKSLNGINESKK